uniref:17-beta-hydroxysteroid dehydrogenase type 3 isoform X3 n=1 Tax=Pogona vitticeps TaxID=103695 RepID=A0ABM5FSR7_9SAUR
MGEFQQLLLSLLGAIICLVFLVKCIRFLKYFIPYIWNILPPSFFRSMGEWAVITGAGDGIGRAYSFELAKRGLNVVLISRTLGKLQKIAFEIEQSTGQKVKIIQADFTKNDIYDALEESLQGLEIGILGPHQLQHHFPHQDDTDNFETDGPKAFTRTFSKALQAEYKAKGIIIKTVTPYSVSTPMTLNSEPNIINKTAEDFAEESLEYIALGEETFGCLAHEIWARFVHCIPLWVFQSERVQDLFQTLISEHLKKNLKST